MRELTGKSRTFTNPILPGFYPDPSICRVGEDYYLVTSSFTYYPGIPIFHSRDLVSWEQIGHVLNSPEQLNLDGLEQSRGIFAPTIRYYKGTFYVITTNVGNGENFIVTARNPAGPWSEPFWLDNAPGIDPSLFFDDDGRAYYIGTRPAPEGEKYSGNWEIWLRELDLTTMTLTGDAYALWRGALREAIWPEGPHLYKINGMYYLMIAEGGTDYHHSVTIARCLTLSGPYEGNPANPILTHRHLGKSYPVVNTGHADLVETQNGEWWMVALASRPYGGYFRNLGRETFLIPVCWEEGWPVVSPGKGRVEFVYEAPNLPEGSEVACPNRDDFNNMKLAHYWNFIRTPREQFWSLTEHPGYLRLKLRPERIVEKVNPSFVGRRQQHMNFIAHTALEFVPSSESESAGMVLIQNNLFHYRFEYSIMGNSNMIRLIKCTKGNEKIISERCFCASRIYMKVEAVGQDYSFYYSDDPDKFLPLAEKVDGRILSTDVAGGFIGAYIGMYCSSNGCLSRNYADFDWFAYTGF